MVGDPADFHKVGGAHCQLRAMGGIRGVSRESRGTAAASHRLFQNNRTFLLSRCSILTPRPAATQLTAHCERSMVWGLRHNRARPGRSNAAIFPPRRLWPRRRKQSLLVAAPAQAPRILTFVLTPTCGVTPAHRLADRVWLAVSPRCPDVFILAARPQRRLLPSGMARAQARRESKPAVPPLARPRGTARARAARYSSFPFPLRGKWK